MQGKPLPAFRETRRQAGEILSQKSNRLKLIEGLLFCLTFFIFGALLEQTCLQIANLPGSDERMQWAAVILAKILFWGSQIFVTAPLVIGLLQMAQRMARGEEAFLADLFLPFRSGNAYSCALTALLPFFERFLLLFALPDLLFGIFELLFGKSLLLSAIETVVLFLLAVAWLLLALRGFVRLCFLLSWKMPLRAARRANRQIAGTSFVGGGRFWLGFLPWILLGFLTVGILLIADVIPRMMIFYFQYTGQMTDFAFSSEEPDHE